MVPQIPHCLTAMRQMGCPPTFPVPTPNTCSWGGAAATFWARLTHPERELVLVRAAAILNAIYDPADPGNQGRTSNQMTGVHCGVRMGNSSGHRCWPGVLGILRC